jgi:beta-lactamase superfamily II metal-dependent hydrolase
MDDQLLVYVYNVGVGDCIYIRVPDRDANGTLRQRHIVVDCGTIDPNADESLLKLAMTHIARMLPTDPVTRRKRLDLLVVTHPHMDHFASFGLESTAARWRRIQIDRLWLNALMDPGNPRAARAREQLHAGNLALQALLEADLHPALSALAHELFSLNQGQIAAGARELLTQGLIPPLYVDDKTPADTLQIFDEPGAAIHVLGPSRRIDADYLGLTDSDPAEVFAEFNRHILTAAGDAANWEFDDSALTISRGDFRRLRARMGSRAVLLAMAQNELINNSSIVFLLTWRGRRLLFTGDAECKFARKGRFEEGKQNFSWNVMWARHRDLLEEPVDFLKVGHHGSDNATPWTGDQPDNEANQILDAIAPRGGTRLRAVVSAARYASWPGNIPRRALLEELGQRIANAHTYDESTHYEATSGGNWPTNPTERAALFVPGDVPQPPRTDLERSRGAPVRYIKVVFRPHEEP